jgi:SHS2 domain-containing protein
MWDKWGIFMGGGYKIIDHTADIGLKIWGKSGPELFGEAARALLSQIIDLDSIQPVQKQAIRIEAESLQQLLHRWLRELLFFVDKGLVFNQFHIENHNLSEKNVSTYYLEGTLAGEKIDPDRHEICKEVKAVTRHNFYIKTKGPWWEAQLILDV